MCCKNAVSSYQLSVISHQFWNKTESDKFVSVSRLARYRSFYPAFLLLHGNYLDEAVYLGVGGLLYIFIMASYSHWKTARIKREKARRKAERAAARAQRAAATPELSTPDQTSPISIDEPVNTNNQSDLNAR